VMKTTPNWKHGSHFYAEPSQVKTVAIFDDEYPDQDTIYMRVGNNFCPCRSVSRENREHWTSVLTAWAARAPLQDLRNNRDIPLPT